MPATTSSSTPTRSTEDSFLIELQSVHHSKNQVEIRIIRKKKEIKQHKKKLYNIKDRIKKLYKQKQTTEGELQLAQNDLKMLQTGLTNGSDSD